jgi:hypothetical protein
LLFGSGLLLSGMTVPQTVLGFLDVTGHWNPALAWTMAAAIVTAAPAFYYMRRKGRTLAGEVATLPARRPVDRRLLGGAVVFGAGWGLTGICPGPALILLTTGSKSIIVFVAAMALGVLVAAHVLQRPVYRRETAARRSAALQLDDHGASGQGSERVHPREVLPVFRVYRRGLATGMHRDDR